MIEGLFETHIDVVDLRRSMEFYEERMGLTLGHLDKGRSAAFYWIGGRGEAMLGLWEKPAGEVSPRHFAFRAGAEEILERSARWLEDRGLAGFNFLGDGTGRPMVFAWMPAVSIYFLDPDGHMLELIGMLEGTRRPELGVVSFEEWTRAGGRGEGG